MCSLPRPPGESPLPHGTIHMPSAPTAKWRHPPLPRAAHPRSKVDPAIRSLPTDRLVRQNGPARPPPGRLPASHATAARGQLSPRPSQKPADRAAGRFSPTRRPTRRGHGVGGRGTPAPGVWYRQNPPNAGRARPSLRRRKAGLRALGLAVAAATTITSQASSRPRLATQLGLHAPRRIAARRASQARPRPPGCPRLLPRPRRQNRPRICPHTRPGRLLPPGSPLNPRRPTAPGLSCRRQGPQRGAEG